MSPAVEPTDGRASRIVTCAYNLDIVIIGYDNPIVTVDDWDNDQQSRTIKLIDNRSLASGIQQAYIS